MNKKNKFIIYTSNPDVMPKSMNDVVNFAERARKFYICNVELTQNLCKVNSGDHIITKKGNNIYVVKTLSESLENLCGSDEEYVNRLAREFGLKKQGVSGIDRIIPFESWCKTARSFSSILSGGNCSTSKTKPAMKNSLKDFSSRLKSTFMPEEASGIRVATDGNICVATEDGYVAIGADNQPVAYPEELVLDFPTYVISRPANQIKAGDVVCVNGKYSKVIEVKEDGKISAIRYTGTGATIHAVKDFVLGQTLVKVVVNLFGNMGNTGINPMMLLALNGKDSGNDTLTTMMMMSAMNGGNVLGGAANGGFNPMLFALLGDKGGDSFKDIMLMSAMSGNGFGGFGNLFGAAPAAAATPVKK